MTQSTRKYSYAFKAKVAIEALKDCESLAELSRRYEVHPNIISKWKKECIEKSAAAFESNPPREKEVYTGKLYARIGQLEIENDSLKKLPESFDYEPAKGSY